MQGWREATDWTIAMRLCELTPLKRGERRRWQYTKPKLRAVQANIKFYLVAFDAGIYN